MPHMQQELFLIWGLEIDFSLPIITVWIEKFSGRTETTALDLPPAHSLPNSAWNEPWSLGGDHPVQKP